MRVDAALLHPKEARILELRIGRLGPLPRIVTGP